MGKPKRPFVSRCGRVGGRAARVGERARRLWSREASTQNMSTSPADQLKRLTHRWKTDRRRYPGGQEACAGRSASLTLVRRRLKPR